MRLAKAPENHVDALRIWLQFNDELCKIDTEYEVEWQSLKTEWEEDEEFGPIIEACDDEGHFSMEGYLNYYRSNITYIHGRITLGYTTLVENCCDPELDYLEFSKEIREAMEK